MAITYRTTGAWGAGKGSNLTPAEVDANFYTLQQAIADALAGLDLPVGIDDITYENGTFTFLLTDASTRGPFDLPLAVFNWKGRWAALTDYLEFDVLYHPSLGGYLVLQDHTSGSTFNPGLQIGGQPVYRLLWRMIPGGLFPVATKSTNTVSFVLADAQTYMRFTNAGETVASVPNNSTQAFPITTEFMIRAVGQPFVFITGAAGVIVNLPAGTSGLSEVGGVAYFKKVDTNEWDVWYGGASGEMPSFPSFPTSTESETASSEPTSEPSSEPTSEGTTSEGSSEATSESEGTGGAPNLRSNNDGGGAGGVSGFVNNASALGLDDLGTADLPIDGLDVRLLINYFGLLGYFGYTVDSDDPPPTITVTVDGTPFLFTFSMTSGDLHAYTGPLMPFANTVGLQDHVVTITPHPLNFHAGTDGTYIGFSIDNAGTGLAIPDMGSTTVGPINDQPLRLLVNAGFIGYLAVTANSETPVTYLDVTVAGVTKVYTFAMSLDDIDAYTGFPFAIVDDTDYRVDIAIGDGPSEAPSETESESESEPTDYSCTRLLDTDFTGSASIIQYYDHTMRQRIPAAWFTSTGTHLRLGFKSGVGTDSTDTGSDGLEYNDGMKVTKVTIGLADSSEGYDLAGAPTEVLFNGGESGFEVIADVIFEDSEYAPIAVSDHVSFAITGTDDVIVSVHFDSVPHKANTNKNHGISGSQLAFQTTGDSTTSTGTWTPDADISATWSNMIEIFDVCTVA